MEKLRHIVCGKFERSKTIVSSKVYILLNPSYFFIVTFNFIVVD